MIYVCCASGTEEVEFVTIVDVLRRGGMEVASVQVEGGSSFSGAHCIEISADMDIDEMSLKDCDLIVLPGGMGGTMAFMNSRKLRSFISDLRQAGKPVAAICAAPMVLGDMGILEGRTATIYPGMEKYLRGAAHGSDRVVIDGDIITSIGPGSAMEFAVALLEYMSDEKTAAEVAYGLQMK